MRIEEEMFCLKCGTQLPDDAVFCLKCGYRLSRTQTPTPPETGPVLASADATSLKCPSCGAPVSPKFGEMIVTCEYCGSSVTLGSGGWTGIQKQTMLPLRIADSNVVTAQVRDLMDQGLLHRHLQENSRLEEMTLSYVPYWLVSVSARTSVTAANVAAEAGTIATTAALAGILGGGLGGRRGGGFGGGLLTGAMMGSMMGGGMGGGGIKKAEELDENYSFPVIALKALQPYQPRDYHFALENRILFDVSKIPKGIKILNGDINEDTAKYQAKTLVDQLQSEKAHAKYHMIQQLNTVEDVAGAELLHAPIWFVRYDYKGNKIILVLDADSGNVMYSMGL